MASSESRSSAQSGASESAIWMMSLARSGAAVIAARAILLTVGQGRKPLPLRGDFCWMSKLDDARGEVGALAGGRMHRVARLFDGGLPDGHARGQLGTVSRCRVPLSASAQAAGVRGRATAMHGGQSQRKAMTAKENVFRIA